MERDIIIELLHNMVMLLAVAAIYSLLPRRNMRDSLAVKLATGFIVGLIGVAIMSEPYVLSPGVFIDVRANILGSAGLFFGPVPTVIAALLMSAFRLLEGGSGIAGGIAINLSAACLGLLWHRKRRARIVGEPKRRLTELGSFGLALHAAMMLSMLLLPQEIRMNAILVTIVPVMAIFPIGTIVLGMLLLTQIDRQGMEDKLALSEERYRSLYENDHIVMLLIEPAGGSIIDANPGACRFYGWMREQLCAMNIAQINTLSPQEIREEMSRAKSSRKTFFHFRHRLASGETRDVEVYSGPISIRGEQLLYSIIHDVTERVEAERRLRESEERYRVTLLSVGDGVIATDETGTITMINKAVENITGWSPEAVIGQSLDEALNIVNEYTREPVENPVGKVLETGNIVGLANHTVLLRDDGGERPIADSAAPIKDENGRIRGVVLVIRDVTEERKKQSEIAYLGYHDSLTGLYNRAFFEEYRKAAAAEQNLPITIIVGDVNGLKMTNDALGHAMGDRLLIQMANTIKSACRRSDVVARWGGDEFIALLTRTDERAAEQIDGKIRANCAKVDMKLVEFSISLGFDTIYELHEGIEASIQRAEDRMYRKKSTESQSMRGKSIVMMLSSLQEVSPQEKEHSIRVSRLCKLLGGALGLTERELNELCLTGKMHDIGKIAVDKAILNKPGALTEEEYADIKRHPEVGYRILSASNNMTYIADYVLSHHERLDGRGYPNGLTAERIPLQSRILAVVDAYDAMTNDRPYRSAMAVDKAFGELRANAGTQFDPKIVEALIQCVGAV